MLASNRIDFPPSHCFCHPFSRRYQTQLIEVRLIRQTEFNRDLRERQVRLQHQALCTLTSPAHHILVRRFVETFPKGRSGTRCLASPARSAELIAESKCASR